MKPFWFIDVIMIIIIIIGLNKKPQVLNKS